MLFSVGKISWSKKLLDHPEIGRRDLVEAFEQYISGDWGEVSQQQALQNDLALTSDEDTMGRYRSNRGVPFYILTTKVGTKIDLLPDCGVLKNPPNPKSSFGNSDAAG